MNTQVPLNEIDDAAVEIENLQEEALETEATVDSAEPTEAAVGGHEASGYTPVDVLSADETLTVSEKTEVSLKPKEKKKKWYIIHTYSGHENKVKMNLERRIESMTMQHKIFRVEAPQKTVTKIKEGKRLERDEKLFPGYVLVEMIMDDDSWHVVRNTPGVTKFVGTQKRPIAAKESEIRRILGKKDTAGGEKAKIVINLKVGDMVTITSGPFTDFEGTVTEVSPEKEKLKASVSIFGRETPVELAFNQVIKL